MKQGFRVLKGKLSEVGNYTGFGSPTRDKIIKLNSRKDLKEVISNFKKELETKKFNSVDIKSGIVALEKLFHILINLGYRENKDRKFQKDSIIEVIFNWYKNHPELEFSVTGKRDEKGNIYKFLCTYDGTSYEISIFKDREEIANSLIDDVASRSDFVYNFFNKIQENPWDIEKDKFSEDLRNSQLFFEEKENAEVIAKDVFKNLSPIEIADYNGNKFENFKNPSNFEEFKDITSHLYWHSFYIIKEPQDIWLPKKSLMGVLKSSLLKSDIDPNKVKFMELRFSSRAYQYMVAVVANLLLTENRLDEITRLFPYKAEGGILINWFGEFVIEPKFKSYFWSKDTDKESDKQKSFENNMKLNQIVYQLAKNFNPSQPIESLFETASKLTGYSVDVLKKHMETCKEGGPFSGDGLYSYWEGVGVRNSRNPKLKEIESAYHYFIRTEINGEKKNYVDVELQAKKYLIDVIQPKVKKMMNPEGKDGYWDYWCSLDTVNFIPEDEVRNTVKEFKKEDWSVWLNGSTYRKIGKQPFGWFTFEQIEDWAKTKILPGYGQTHD